MNTEKKNPRDAVIVAAGRSAMAKAFKGSFAETHPIEYGAQVLKGVLTKLDHFDPALIDDVIVGCAFPEKRMGYNAAKLIVQRAGLPDSVCAQTINRFCSSGLQSIATAANAIKAGDMDIIVAGGCEQMTGMNMVDPDIEIDEKLMEENPDAYIIMGETAELVAEKYNRKIRNPYDLEPEEEALIGRYFKEEYDADFVFVTHYPSKKRPFYAMDDPQDDKFTLSFDLLFHGLEVTTGGQRIHDYNQLKAKIAARGMEEEGMEQYLDTFKHGMPPHGGLGIGLERLTMQLLGEENVREACLFPRDLNRLEP